MITPKISKLPPPNIKQIELYLKPRNGMVFAYGDTIHVTGNTYLDTPLFLHEYYHLKQQEDFGGAEKWWDRYLKDKHFRLAQELPAYQIQLRECEKHIGDRSRVFRIAKYLAEDLSSDMYGNMIGFNEALNLIRQKNLIVYKLKEEEVIDKFGKKVPKPKTDFEAATLEAL